VRRPGELVTPYYLRFGVADRPGVLAQLTRILGEHGVSIHQLVQEGAPRLLPSGESRATAVAPAATERPVSVVMTTHAARESDVQTALAEIARLPVTLGPTRLIRIEA
jgi:homoserine dehydrogenase